MKVRYSATFEFPTQAPITATGAVAATSMPTCFARAAREAKAKHPGLSWSSMVICVERVTETGQESAQ